MVHYQGASIACKLSPHKQIRTSRYLGRATLAIAAVLLTLYSLQSSRSEISGITFAGTSGRGQSRGHTRAYALSSGGSRLSRTALRARRFIVGGNWKANGTPQSVRKLVEDLNNGDTSTDVQVVCAPPSIYLGQVKQHLRPDFDVAAQNMWNRAPGAWTGELPADMLASVGIGWVILGHSERRENCGETSQIVADKTKFAVDSGLNTITCIGEKLEAREAGKTFEVLDEQMKPLGATLAEEDWEKVVLAYEPVWAIGTGLVATPEQAEEAHAYLRKWLWDNVSPKVSESVRIQYGGSVNDQNSADLAGKPNIDGFLVGGASLDAGKFTAIINSAPAREGR